MLWVVHWAIKAGKFPLWILRYILPQHHGFADVALVNSENTQLLLVHLPRCVKYYNTRQLVYTGTFVVDGVTVATTVDTEELSVEEISKELSVAT